MAAGIVYHNITTATGVTFSLACWVPDTAAPDVGAIPVSFPIKSDGSVGPAVSIASGGVASGAIASGAVASGAVASGAFASGAIADGADVTLGAKADAKSTATDTTAVTAMSVLKQISASVQAPPSQVVTNTYMTQFGTGKYVAVAAGQTDAVIQASSGASGDYLDHVVVVPATTAPGVVTIKDNATALISYPGGGTTALLTLTPFTIYVGAVSSSGAWKVTTGANVSILAVGKFS